LILQGFWNYKVYKDFFNKKPRTRYNLTAKGRDEFIDYVNTLENILKQMAINEGRNFG
jgi:hypothetical protein